MDLWIRSQDKFTMQVVTKGIQIIDYHGLKEKLEKSPLSFLKDMEQIKTYTDKEGWGLNVDEICLGIYETKERAIEVLDEIQKYLNSDITFNLDVYEMPKE